MSAQADDTPPEAGKLPTGRLARTARVGGLVTGQGLRWAGMRTANRLRTPERAAAARSERTAAAVQQLVDQLGQMRGAAMKVGQMISMVEFDGLPEDEQDELQRSLAALRENVPPVPFADLEKLMRQEFGGPLAARVPRLRRACVCRGLDRPGPSRHDRRRRRRGREDPVPRRRGGGRDGPAQRDAAAAARQAARPGLDAKALAAEMRERIGEELDYELEAQNQRRIERLMRGHPFVRVPRVRTDLSTRRVLVSEYVEGERFEAVRRADEAQRDRYGEIVFRFFFGLLYRDRIALGDPHPGNYLLCPDGRVCFLDFGLLRDVDADRVAAERAIARAVRDGDAAAVKAALLAGGYLPASRATRSTPTSRWA